MHPHTLAEDYYRDTAHPAGMGPGGWGAGAVMPLPFPDRAATDRYDDLYGSRPVARPALGHQLGGQLQLRNGVSTIVREGRMVDPVGMFATRPVNTPRMVLPGDRAIIPPSPSQIQAWAAATAGQQPQTAGGNGTVAVTWPIGGGAF